MNKLPPRRPISRAWSILALAVLLVSIGVLYPISVRADAGEFPTKTPTITPSPTVTHTPTVTPSPTSTLIPTLTLVPLIEQEVQPQQPPAAAPLTTPAQEGSRSLLACWPILLFLFLAIVVAATYLLTRRTRFEEA